MIQKYIHIATKSKATVDTYFWAINESDALYSIHTSNNSKKPLQFISFHFSLVALFSFSN